MPPVTPRPVIFRTNFLELLPCKLEASKIYSCSSSARVRASSYPGSNSRWFRLLSSIKLQWTSLGWHLPITTWIYWAHSHKVQCCSLPSLRLCSQCLPTRDSSVRISYSASRTGWGASWIWQATQLSSRCHVHRSMRFLTPTTWTHSSTSRCQDLQPPRAWCSLLAPESVNYCRIRCQRTRCLLTSL